MRSYRCPLNPITEPDAERTAVLERRAWLRPVLNGGSR